MAEQIRVDITADDKASRKIDDVADAAERLEDADPKVTATADTKPAERALDGLEGDVRAVERLSPEVTVDADTDAALRGIDDVKREADQLTDADREIILKAKSDDAKAALADMRSELDSLQGKAKETQDRLDDVTGGDRARFTARGNAISDLTGPLGEVSSTASDVAGVFDGFSDILEGLAPKMGISAEKMVGAIGGIGFAITAAATLWGYFSQKQEAAAQKQQKIIDGQKKINELIADQKFAQAGEQIVETYSDAYDAARKLGISTEDLTLFLTGQKDITKQLDDAQQAYTGGLEKTSVEYTTQNNKVTQLTGAVTDAKAAYDDANGSLATQATRADQAADALQGTKRDTDDVKDAQKRLEDQTRRTSEQFDRLRGAVNLDQELLRVQTSIDTAMTNAQAGVQLTQDEVLDLKSDIITLAETAKANPADVKSTLEKIDRGDLAGVKADAENYYAHAPVEVTGKLTVTNLVDAARKAASALTFGFGATATSSAAAAPAVSQVFTFNLPRGIRPQDALAAADNYARRNGGVRARR